MLSRFALLHDCNLVENLHGIQSACIVSGQFTHQENTSISYMENRNKCLDKLDISLISYLMLTSRAKHANDFKVV